MKNIKYSFKIFMAMALMLFVSCQEDDLTVGDIVAPSNIQITVDIVGADAANPYGDGSGTVHFTASANDAISYHYVYNGATTLGASGNQSYDFPVLGLNTYGVTVVAFGTGGVSSSKTIEVEVLATYAPPADLVQMLHANSSRVWRIKAESNPHFGLGPIGGFTPGEWFSAGAFSKDATGMYDDRYTFNADGTFTHDTGDDGTVFGREPLITELGPHSETPNGADIENYPLDDYTAQWTLTAPGGTETISLTGTAFIGYYTGGNHKYRIFSRSANEMILSTADGNNEFEWWFTLVPE